MRKIKILVILFYFLFPFAFYYFKQDYNAVYFFVFLAFKALFFYSVFAILDIINMKFLKIIAFVIMFLPYITSVVFIFMYNSFMKTAGVLALFNTDTGEAANFSRGLWWLYLVLLFSYVAISVLYLKTTFVSKRMMTSGVRYFFVFSTVLLISIAGQVVYSKKIDGTGGSYFHHFKLRMIKEFPVNLYFRLYEKMLIDKQSNEYREKISDFSFGAVKKDNKDQKEVHIFIIGETQRSDLYRKELKKKVRGYDNFFKENMTIFPDFYSTANATAYCIPLMVTRATVDEEDLTFKEPGIMKLFDEAGYKTFWISNVDIFREVPAEFFKKDVDVFMPLYKKKRSDAILLKGLKEALADTAKRKFIIMNVRGNHYFDYPKQYDHYKPNIGTENIGVISRKHRGLYINSYNNMTIFQLEMLDNLIGMIDSCNVVASVTFSSDHGESVFEPPYYFYGHGSSTVPPEQVHVFAFEWLSDEYKNSYPVKYRMVNEHKDKLISTDYIFYTLADVANISYKKENPAYMISDPGFKELNELKVRGDGAPVVVDVTGNDQL